jgi:oxepin-CoA hydrolase/3-oxo-5,6-dehydrosuberyl-CoA semialdehyde dehydrogenase
MLTVRFDVNDPELRYKVLRDRLADALSPLGPGEAARWGKMTAQQMVEHLAWTFEVSTGRARVECPVPEADRARMKRFLYSNRPSPPGFMNPALVDGLPPLRHPGLAEAREALRAELARFLEDSAAAPERLHTHPVFGPINGEEWSRTHFKHAVHHLLQFGLVEIEPEAADNRGPTARG